MSTEPMIDPLEAVKRAIESPASIPLEEVLAEYKKKLVDIEQGVNSPAKLIALSMKADYSMIVSLTERLIAKEK